jgi:CD63 antigen
MVSGGMTCVKYLLFVFNLLFFVSGVVMLAIGAVIYVVYAHYYNFVYDSFQSAPLILIIVGVIIFLVAFFGCCGACKENHCMIITVPFYTILNRIRTQIIVVSVFCTATCNIYFGSGYRNCWIHS